MYFRGGCRRFSGRRWRRVFDSVGRSVVWKGNLLVARGSRPAFAYNRSVALSLRSLLYAACLLETRLIEAVDDRSLEGFALTIHVAGFASVTAARLIKTSFLNNGHKSRVRARSFRHQWRDKSHRDDSQRILQSRVGLNKVPEPFGHKQSDWRLRPGGQSSSSGNRSCFRLIDYRCARESLMRVSEATYRCARESLMRVSEAEKG